MAASFTVTLDTIAPQITLGEAQLLGPNIRIQYTLDEPDVVSAELVDTGPMTVTPTEFYAPSTALSGTVRVHTRDDVLNEAWFEVMYSVPFGDSVVGVVATTIRQASLRNVLAGGVKAITQVGRTVRSVTGRIARTRGPR